jgi:hypothetical protein
MVRIMRLQPAAHIAPLNSRVSSCRSAVSTALCASHQRVDRCPLADGLDDPLRAF